MPRIRRWHPVSHDLNADAEVWELTERFGDRALRVWLEILSITDRTQGVLRGDREHIVSTLGARCRMARKTIRSVLDYALSKSWLISDGILRTRNYAEYHRTREPKKPPQGKPKGSPPSEPSLPSQPLSTSPPPPSPQNGWGTPEALVALYNGLKPVEAPTVTRLTPARTKKARTYLAIFPAEDFWRTVLVEAGRSPMLRGLKPSVGHEHFRFSFDWMLTRGKDGTENAIKVAEGRYRDDAQKGPTYRTMAKCPTCAAHHFTDEGCERE